MTTAAPATRRLRYRPELDGLRGVAVMLVLVYHVLQPARFAGFLGVDVFFVLSGFLITTILLAEHRGSATLRLGMFYARRFLRLYPALLTMLVLSFPLYVAVDAGGDLTVQAKRAVVAATYTGNLYMTYRHQWLGPDAHTWSLALEEQYYLVWPLLLLLALRLGLRRTGLVAVLLVGAAGASALSVRDFTFGTDVFPVQSTCGGLLIGSALAVLFDSSPRSMRACSAPAVGALGVALLGACLVDFSLTRRVPDGWFVPAAEVATALVIAQTTADFGRRLLGRVLSWPPAVWIGKISYGVYLWHYPLVLVCAHELSGWPPWARLAVVALVSLALAWASFTIVETPFLRWKNRLGRGVDDAQPHVPDPSDTHSDDTASDVGAAGGGSAGSRATSLEHGRPS